MLRMAAKVVFFISGFEEWRTRWSSSIVALWRPALKHWGFCGMLRMAAKVVFFSNGFVEASPETLGFCGMQRMAAKVVFFSRGFVEASPETLGFL